MLRGELLAQCSSSELVSQAWLPFESSGIKLKRYMRRDAGQQAMLASEVRPPSVLEQGVVLLISTCLAYPSDNAEAINWFLDRSRAIRQDFTVQMEWIESDREQLGHYLTSMVLLCRFLIYLQPLPATTVDLKFFNDALAACTSNVLHADASNEECRAYSELVWGQRFPFELPHLLVRLARERNWILFKQEFARSDLLVQRAAIKGGWLGEVQFQGLLVLNSSFMGKFPLAAVRDWLCFPNATGARLALGQAGVNVNEEDCVEFKKSVLLQRPTLLPSITDGDEQSAELFRRRSGETKASF
ncbi:hypothetical protein BASA81_009139 [Batrachochytrium salamandrivorans]|nr:hypothetical protein BASA81_009139 [Batrachochytrium salamandrivorans]